MNLERWQASEIGRPEETLSLGSQRLRGELFGVDGFGREALRVSAQDDQADQRGTGEQKYPQNAGMQGWITQKSPQQAKGGAGGAEGKVQPLSSVACHLQENQQDGCNDGVDDQ